MKLHPTIYYLFVERDPKDSKILRTIFLYLKHGEAPISQLVGKDYELLLVRL